MSETALDKLEDLLGVDIERRLVGRTLRISGWESTILSFGGAEVLGENVIHIKLYESIKILTKREISRFQPGVIEADERTLKLLMDWADS